MFDSLTVTQSDLFPLRFCDETSLKRTCPEKSHVTPTLWSLAWLLNSTIIHSGSFKKCHEVNEILICGWRWWWSRLWGIFWIILSLLVRRSMQHTPEGLSVHNSNRVKFDCDKVNRMQDLGTKAKNRFTSHSKWRWNNNMPTYDLQILSQLHNTHSEWADLTTFALIFLQTTELVNYRASVIKGRRQKQRRRGRVTNHPAQRESARTPAYLNVLLKTRPRGRMLA